MNPSQNPFPETTQAPNVLDPALSRVSFPDIFESESMPEVKHLSQSTAAQSLHTMLPILAEDKTVGGTDARQKRTKRS